MHDGTISKPSRLSAPSRSRPVLAARQLRSTGRPGCLHQSRCLSHRAAIWALEGNLPPAGPLNAKLESLLFHHRLLKCNKEGRDMETPLDLLFILKWSIELSLTTSMSFSYHLKYEIFSGPRGRVADNCDLWKSNCCLASVCAIWSHRSKWKHQNKKKTVYSLSKVRFFLILTQS